MDSHENSFSGSRVCPMRIEGRVDLPKPVAGLPNVPETTYERKFCVSIHEAFQREWKCYLHSFCNCGTNRSSPNLDRSAAGDGLRGIGVPPPHPPDRLIACFAEKREHLTLSGFEIRITLLVAPPPFIGILAQVAVYMHDDNL